MNKHEMIIIEETNKMSKQDIEDLKMLLEDIKERYNFKWHIHIDKNGENKKFKNDK